MAMSAIVWLFMSWQFFVACNSGGASSASPASSHARSTPVEQTASPAPMGTLVSVSAAALDPTFAATPASPAEELQAEFVPTENKQPEKAGSTGELAQSPLESQATPDGGIEGSTSANIAATDLSSVQDQTLSSTALTASGCTVSWSPPGDASSSTEGLTYTLYYSTEQSAVSSLSQLATISTSSKISVPRNATSLTVSGLLPKTIYYIALVVTNQVGSAAMYKPKTITTYGGPSVSGVLTLSAQSSTSITLAWTAASNDVPAASMQYRVYGSALHSISTAVDMEKNGTLLGNGLTKPTVQITDLVPGGTYYFNVLAVDSMGNTAAYQMTGPQTMPNTIYVFPYGAHDGKMGGRTGADALCNTVRAASPSISASCPFSATTHAFLLLPGETGLMGRPSSASSGVVQHAETKAQVSPSWKSFQNDLTACPSNAAAPTCNDSLRVVLPSPTSLKIWFGSTDAVGQQYYSCNGFTSNIDPPSSSGGSGKARVLDANANTHMLVINHFCSSQDQLICYCW